MIVAAAGAVLVMLMVVLVIVAAAGAVLIMLVVMMVVLVLMLQFFHLVAQVITAHQTNDLLAAELVPGSADKADIGIEPSKQLAGLQDSIFLCGIGAAHNDNIGIFNLVVEKLAEVSHVHTALACINNGYLCADLNALNLLNGSGNIRQLAYTGGLDDNAVGSIIVNNLLQSLSEVTYQRAANTAGAHLGNLNAGISQKAAVNGYLAEIVLDEDQLFTLIALFNEFADKSGLACTEEAGKNIYYGHINILHIY